MMNPKASPLLAPYAHCVRPSDWSDSNKHILVNVAISGLMSEGRYRDAAEVLVNIVGPGRTGRNQYEITQIQSPQGNFTVNGNEIKLGHVVPEKLAAMLVGKSLDHLIELPGCSAIITKIQKNRVFFEIKDPAQDFTHTKESWDALRYNNRIDQVLQQKLPASLKLGFDALSDDELISIMNDLAYTGYKRIVLRHNNQDLTVSLHQDRKVKDGAWKQTNSVKMEITPEYRISDSGMMSFPILPDGISGGLVGIETGKVIDHWAVRQSKVRKADAKVKKTVIYITFEKMTLREMLKDRLSLIERKDHPLLSSM